MCTWEGLKLVANLVTPVHTRSGVPFTETYFMVQYVQYVQYENEYTSINKMKNCSMRALNEIASPSESHPDIPPTVSRVAHPMPMC